MRKNNHRPALGSVMLLQWLRSLHTRVAALSKMLEEKSWHLGVCGKAVG